MKSGFLVLKGLCLSRRGQSVVCCESTVSRYLLVGLDSDV